MKTADVVAIDKPAGMVVHAGAGVHSGTVVNALLHRFGALSGGRRRAAARHRAPARPLHQRRAAGGQERRRPSAAGGAILGPAGGKGLPGAGARQGEARERAHRTAHRARPRASHPHDGAAGPGRAAWSEYRVLRRFERFTLLEVRIGTGRTHQIRVHLSSIGHPVAGDTLYGAPAKWRAGRRWAASSCTPTGSASTSHLRARRSRWNRRCLRSWRSGWRGWYRAQCCSLRGQHPTFPMCCFWTLNPAGCDKGCYRQESVAGLGVGSPSGGSRRDSRIDFSSPRPRCAVAAVCRSVQGPAATPAPSLFSD